MSPSVTLVCLGRAGADWAAALAPEVAVTTTGPGWAEPAAPYALLGSGSDAEPAVHLAIALAGGGRGPTHLVLARCPAPPPDLPGVRCRVTVFADAGGADDGAAWARVAGGEFTLRLLAGFGAPAAEPAAAEIALALKEELRVWPY